MIWSRRFAGTVRVVTALALGHWGAAYAQEKSPIDEGPDQPSPSQSAASGRRLTLDEALRLATQNSLDLRQAQARLDQAAVNVENAWVALLPNATLQGKYTHNYKEVTLDFASLVPTGPGSVTALSAQLQADVATDLYTKIGQAPSNQVLSDQQALAAAAKQAQASLPTGPIVIQKGEQLDGAVNLTVPLVAPSAWYGLRSARRSVSAAQSGFAVSRATIMLAVAQAFYLAAGADEVLGARREAIGVAKRTLDDARSKIEAGTANRVELTRAQVAYERAAQAAEEADATRAQAYRGLATSIGVEGDFVVEPGSGPRGQFQPGEDLGKQALKLRPEFQQAERTILSNDDLVRSNLWKWSPTISGFGNARVFNYAGFSGDKYSWALGLELDWVIYDGGARDAQRHLAAAQNAEQRARLELLQHTVRDDIETARQQVNVKHSALATATHAVQLSQETLALVRVQHDAGTATQLDLLSAQDQLVASELSLAQARFDLALADLTLQRQVGTFPNIEPDGASAQGGSLTGAH